MAKEAATPFCLMLPSPKPTKRFEAVGGVYRRQPLPTMRGRDTAAVLRRTASGESEAYMRATERHNKRLSLGPFLTLILTARPNPESVRQTPACGYCCPGDSRSAEVLLDRAGAIGAGTAIKWRRFGPFMGLVLTLIDLREAQRRQLEAGSAMQVALRTRIVAG